MSGSGGWTAAERDAGLQSGVLRLRLLSHAGRKRTAEREEEFAFSRHPAITAFTSMNVETPTIMAYLFDHPLYLVALIAGVLLFCLRRIMH